MLVGALGLVRAEMHVEPDATALPVVSYGAEAAEVAAAGDEDLVEEESPADSLDGSDEDEDMD